MIQSALNYVGAIPDILMQASASMLRRKNHVSYYDYIASLRYYQASDWQKKPFFKLPRSAPEYEKILSASYHDGQHQTWRYPSRYAVRNPAVAESFAEHEKNMSGYLHMWQHDLDEKPPIVLCLHGFMMGDLQRIKSMFKVGRLFSQGVDVAGFVLPHHGVRGHTRLEQHLLNPEDLPLTIEGMGQNIHDLHSAILLLKKAGYERIGIIGGSLGGLTAALYATVAKDVEFMFYVVPAVDLCDYLSPESASFDFRITEELRQLSDQAMQLITPDHYQPKMDVNKMSVVVHAGDKLNDARYTRRWIRNWSIPNLVEVTGGHWLHFDQKARGRAWYGWLKQMNFIK